MPSFVKLTHALDGDPFTLNLDHVVVMEKAVVPPEELGRGPSGQGKPATKLVLRSSQTIFVEQTEEQIEHMRPWPRRP